MTEEQTGLFRDNLNLICASTKLVMDKVARAFYKNQQQRAQAAPNPTAVGGGVEVAPDSFREGNAKHSEMEAA